MIIQHNSGHTIKVTKAYVPYFRYDYQATLIGHDDCEGCQSCIGCAIGYGLTEEKAIEALLDVIHLYD